VFDLYRCSMRLSKQAWDSFSAKVCDQPVNKGPSGPGLVRCKTGCRRRTHAVPDQRDDLREGEIEQDRRDRHFEGRKQKAADVTRPRQSDKDINCKRLSTPMTGLRRCGTKGKEPEQVRQVELPLGT
jgi:hypothetical protein